MQGTNERFDTSALSFQNNYALATEISNMPTKDLTVEFWARTPKYENNNGSSHQEFLSFATHLPGGTIPAHSAEAPSCVAWWDAAHSSLHHVPALLQNNSFNAYLSTLSCIIAAFSQSSWHAALPTFYVMHYLADIATRDLLPGSCCSCCFQPLPVFGEQNCFFAWRPNSSRMQYALPLVHAGISFYALIDQNPILKTSRSTCICLLQSTMTLMTASLWMTPS